MHYVINSFAWSLNLEANSCWTFQEISIRLWELKTHCLVFMIPRLMFTLRQMDQVHTCTRHSFKIHFIIIISSIRVFKVASSLEDVDLNALGYSFLISPMHSNIAFLIKSLITMLKQSVVSSNVPKWQYNSEFTALCITGREKKLKQLHWLSYNRLTLFYLPLLDFLIRHNLKNKEL